MLARRQLGELLLGRLLIAFAWEIAIAYPELCQPDAQNAFKVRLSIKTALKENAYSWDATEEYLFKAMLAYAMRRYLIQETTQDLRNTLEVLNTFSPKKTRRYTHSLQILSDCQKMHQICSELFQSTGGETMSVNGNENHECCLYFLDYKAQSKVKEDVILIRISNVLLCNVTSRVSFWFVVTNSFTNMTTIPRNDVEAAIRMNRNRINNAFLLTDDTLEFLEISSTLAPPAEQPLPIWLIVFGVILGIIVIGIVSVVSFGIYHRKRHKNAEKTEDLDDIYEAAITMENRIPCHTSDLKAGQINGVYAAADDDQFTPL